MKDLEQEIKEWTQQRYQLVQTIQGGAMADVFIVHPQGQPSRWRVLKVLSLNLLTDPKDPEPLNLFRQEAQFLKERHSLSTPQLLDYWEDLPDRACIVMNYFQGTPLDHLLSTVSRLPLANVVALQLFILDILRPFHQHQPPIVYRDLKPSNFLLDNEGFIWLIDFGTARLFVPSKNKDTQPLGTPGFCAPEQYEGGVQSTPATDLYGWAVLGLHLLTGQEPLRHQPLEWLDEQEIPLEIKEVWKSCLQQDPKQRPQSAEPFYSKLTSWIAKQPQTPRTQTLYLPLQKMLKRLKTSLQLDWPTPQ